MAKYDTYRELPDDNRMSQSDGQANAPFPTKTPKQRLDDLLIAQRENRRRLAALGPSMGSNPANEAMRNELIANRQQIESQARPLSTMIAGVGPRIAANSPQAEAGRQDLARQGAAALNAPSGWGRPPATVQKGPADFADDNKMRLMGLNPGSDADKSTYQSMLRMTSQTQKAAGTGSPTGQDAANQVSGAIRASGYADTSGEKNRMLDIADSLMARKSQAGPAPAQAPVTPDQFYAKNLANPTQSVPGQREQIVADATNLARSQEGERQTGERYQRDLASTMNRSNLAVAGSVGDLATEGVNQARSKIRGMDAETTLTTARAGGVGAEAGLATERTRGEKYKNDLALELGGPQARLGMRGQEADIKLKEAQTKGIIDESGDAANERRYARSASSNAPKYVQAERLAQEVVAGAQAADKSWIFGGGDSVRVPLEASLSQLEQLLPTLDPVQQEKILTLLSSGTPNTVDSPNLLTQGIPTAIKDIANVIGGKPTTVTNAQSIAKRLQAIKQGGRSK